MNKFTITAAILGLSSGAAFGATLFDGTSTGEYYFAGENEVGEYFQLSSANATVTSIAEIDLYVSAATTYSSLELQVSFFGSGQTTYTGSGNEFSDLLTTVTYGFGANSLGIGGYRITGLTLPTPIVVSGSDIGAQFTWLNAGARTTAAANATTLFSLSNTTPPNVGLNAATGGGLDLFELDSGATTSATPLAQSSNLYQAGDTYENAAVILGGTQAVPEPPSYAFLGLGIIGLAVGRRRSRKR
jgi:hypothetical protein